MITRSVNSFAAFQPNVLFLLLDMITRWVTYLIKKRLHDYIDHRLDCECDVYDDLIEKRMITISDQYDTHDPVNCPTRQFLSLFIGYLKSELIIYISAPR